MPAVDIDNVVSTSMDIFTGTPPTLTLTRREHDFVRDTLGPLYLYSLSVSVKSEKVGRSGAVLLSLANSSKEGLCVNVRTQEEFKLGTLQNPLNLPSEGAFSETGDLVGNREELEMARRKGRVIAVLGTVKKIWKIIVKSQRTILKLIWRKS